MGKHSEFRFKQFSVCHERASLPVGMDGVLIGAWADVSRAQTILDVGTGCGVIALMCAQRNPHADVTAIDIHTPSVEEAAENFCRSQWSSRLYAAQADFEKLSLNNQLVPAPGFDLIISNPPFFNSGLHPDKENARLTARHTSEFGPATLLSHGTKLLSPTGSIALIAPAEQEEELTTCAVAHGLYMHRICHVYTKSASAPKRVMLQASKIAAPLMESDLIIRATDGNYTDSYRALTGDFYTIF